MTAGLCTWANDGAAFGDTVGATLEEALMHADDARGGADEEMLALPHVDRLVEGQYGGVSEALADEREVGFIGPLCCLRLANSDQIPERILAPVGNPFAQSSPRRAPSSSLSTGGR